MWRKYSELSFENLKVSLNKFPKSQPKDFSKLLFGSVFTDHMLEIDWNELSGWQSPEIKPYQPIKLDPASSVFSYCTECYEGFKVYSQASNLLAFRPLENMKRFNLSSSAAALPVCDPVQLLKCIDELIRIDKSWVPTELGYSLYVRPNMFGTHAQLADVKPKSAKIVVILSPVGPYFSGGLKPLSLYCNDDLIRAWPSGHGNKKLGGNYAPGIPIQEKYKQNSYDQILWLSHNTITEVGVMNFFSFWKTKNGYELITSPINNTVLPGITRLSVMQLCQEWGEFKVSEKDLKINDLINGISSGEVLEMFGTGTAAVICPVNKIAYKEQEYSIDYGHKGIGMLALRLLDFLQQIQYGKIRHQWSHYI